MDGGTTPTLLYTALTIWADRDCRQSGNSEGGGITVLLTTDGVILDVSLRNSFSASQMLNFDVQILSRLSTERVRLRYLLTCVYSSAVAKLQKQNTLIYIYDDY